MSSRFRTHFRDCLRNVALDFFRIEMRIAGPDCFDCSETFCGPTVQRFKALQVGCRDERDDILAVLLEDHPDVAARHLCQLGPAELERVGRLRNLPSMLPTAHDPSTDDTSMV